MRAAPSKAGRWLIPSSLVLLTVAVFWRVSQHEFILYDDPDYVTQNLRIQRGLTADGLAWAFGQLRGEFTYWHPLTWVSHMVDCQLFGLKAGPHHLMNLFFHVVNVLLLFSVVRRMTGAVWPSALVAALWAIHPLQVESVAWVTERKNLLSGTFWLLTTGAYVRYAEKPSVGRYALVFLGMALGLLAKPVLVTLPCVFLLLDTWPLDRARLWSNRATPTQEEMNRPVFEPRPWPLLLAEKLPLLLLSLASGILTIVGHQQLGLIIGGESLPLGARCASALVAYGHYVGRTLVPAGLAVFYPHPGVWQTWQVMIGGLVVFGVLGVALWQARRVPWLLVGWCWLLGVLVPTIGLVQAGDQVAADRFMYLPLVGLLLGLVWGGRALLSWVGAGPRVLTAVAISFVVVCAALSAAQVRHWRNTRTLFEHTLRVTSDNYLAHAVLGSLEGKEGRLASATAHFSRALEIKPNYFEGRTQLADLLRAQQKLDEAILQYAEALRWNPAYADALNGLGAALVLQGKPQEGLAQLDRAVQLNPQLLSARVHRGLALSSLGRVAEATEEFNQVLRMNAGAVNALLGLGNSLLAQRRFTEAIRCYRQLLALKPDSVPALNRLAWLVATHSDPAIRDGPEAVRLATRACQLTANNDPLSLSALAAAYAETGQFDQAVATAQRALDLATASGQGSIAAILQKLLELFRARTPYRE
jgi:tetratricopeptide (TPR) repeat protein